MSDPVEVLREEADFLNNTNVEEMVERGHAIDAVLTELEQLRAYVGDEMLRSDFQTAGHMRQAYEQLRARVEDYRRSVIEAGRVLHEYHARVAELEGALDRIERELAMTPAGDTLRRFVREERASLSGERPAATGPSSGVSTPSVKATGSGDAAANAASCAAGGSESGAATRTACLSGEPQPAQPDWWCCKADYPNHEPTCRNAEPTPEPGR